jgi:hypothetical protein
MVVVGDEYGDRRKMVRETEKRKGDDGGGVVVMAMVMDPIFPSRAAEQKLPLCFAQLCFLFVVRPPNFFSSCRRSNTLTFCICISGTVSLHSTLQSKHC